MPPENEKYGAFHSAEIAYALNALHMWRRPWTDADKKIEETMSSYWVNFATYGNPNGKGLPGWKPYNDLSPAVMEFDEKETGMKPMTAKTGFDFIDKYQEQLRQNAK